MLKSKMDYYQFLADYLLMKHFQFLAFTPSLMRKSKKAPLASASEGVVCPEMGIMKASNLTATVCVLGLE